jgi:biotin carboxylase
VVVDPVGTGQEYPTAFAEAGVATVAVLSGAEPIHHFQGSWHPEKFAHIHRFGGDLDKLAGAVGRHDPLCVVAGAETGVELADALCERVLPGTGNPPAPPGTLCPRRNKWAMAQAVERAGLPHLRQFCSADPAEIARWLAGTGLSQRRLVLKPPNSGGTDDVHFVPPGQDWRPYFDQIYGKLNTLELRNDAVLVGEYVEGTEYMIDSYSVDGAHGLVDVCRYVKSQRGDRLGLYDLVEFLAPDHPAVAEVWPYAQRVLDAVQVRNGCAHTEVILSPEGPRFLEVGARPAGGGHQMITTLATGDNQVRRTVQHRVHGRHQPSYQLVQHVCSVVINSPAAGVWRNPELFDQAKSLPTYWADHFEGRSGEPVPASVDFVTYLGWVVLAGPDQAAVAADYRHLKELERQIRIDERSEHG